MKKSLKAALGIGMSLMMALPVYGAPANTIQVNGANKPIIMPRFNHLAFAAFSFFTNSDNPTRALIGTDISSAVKAQIDIVANVEWKDNNGKWKIVKTYTESAYAYDYSFFREYTVKEHDPFYRIKFSIYVTANGTTDKLEEYIYLNDY